jgi:hypothetical protein
MVRTSDPGVEQMISLDDSKPFVEKQDVPAGASSTRDNWAYKITGPEGYVIFVQAGTQFAPEFRDNNGNKLDPSSRVKFQKCNKQGDPLNEYVLSELISRFDYERMRNDPDYFRETQRDLMLDEREIAKIFVEIPSGASGFSAGESRLTIGDDTSDFGQPVEIVDHDGLTTEESQAVKAANQR